MFKNHPKGLIPAALSNMGERFGYYIMNAVLLLFLCSKFGLDEGLAGGIYAVFYAGIYVLSLVGGLIADRTQNYKSTIQWGLVIMAVGYVLLSIPVVHSAGNHMWLLTFTCVALFLIAFGNGLFKGNLQAIVGQMYDNMEADAIAKGVSDDELKSIKERRDSGFQIFYVFINIGGLIAPFVAPLLRQWWLGVKGMVYDAGLPALCHQYISDAASMTSEQMANLTQLMEKANPSMVGDMTAAANSYLEVFNTGVHYSFIASVIAMFISLAIFMVFKKIFPTPAKKEAAAAVEYTAEEKRAMAKEIKQRMYALFAVLGVCVFFWLSFHQNGRAISTPRKIVIGMFITGLAYLFLMLLSMGYDYPNGEDFRAMDIAQQTAMKSQWWVLIATYFFLTVAELFISPLGLSFVSKIAPKHLQGICQGLWLGATALGNLFIWIGPVMLNGMPKLWMCWAVFLVICLVAMGVMWGMVKWLERVTE